MEKLEAYAKVNIGLKVMGKRPDGYHDIDSFFLLTPLHDVIYIDSTCSSEPKVSIEGNEGYMEGGMDLMEKAARRYMDYARLSLDVSIRIEKNIPSKAGLGGGSSDAASVLVYLEKRYGKLGREGLLSLSAGLGADIPFFVSGFTLAHVGGIGEKIEERDPSLLDYSFISFFRTSSEGVSTKEAYALLDSIPRDGKLLPEINGKVKRCEYPNDFEKTGSFPVLEYLENTYGEKAFWSLSGSGDVAFVLSDEAAAGNCPLLISSLPLDL